MGNYFSSNIVALRKKKGLTTAKVAQSLKVTEETLVAWELGMKEPQAKDLLKIAKFYGVDTSDLVNTPLGVQEEPKKTNDKNVKTENNSCQKTSKKSIVLQSIVIALSAITLITFALTYFKLDLGGGFSVLVSFFDLLTPEKFYFENFLCWLILLTVLYNIVNCILMLTSTRIKNTRYNKIGRILMLSLNGSALLFWIITTIEYRDFDVTFGVVWLYLAILGILTCLILETVGLNRTKIEEAAENVELKRGVVNSDKLDKISTTKTTNKKQVNKTQLTSNPEVSTSAFAINGINTTTKGYLALQIIVMALSSITLIIFGTSFYNTQILNLELYVTFFNMLSPSEFTLEALLCWLILFFVLYNIVNGILLLSSQKLRNGKYNKLSQILMLSFNGAALIFWSIVAMQYKGWDFNFGVIWLFALFVLNLILLTFANVKVNGRKLKITFFYIFAAATIIALLFAIAFVFSASYEIECWIIGSSGHTDYDYKYYEYINSSVFVFLSFIITLVVLILLMINKLRNKKGAKIGLGVTGIVMSVLMLPIHLITDAVTNSFIEKNLLDGYYYTNVTLMDGELLANTILIASILMLIASILVLTIKCKKAEKKIDKK